MTKKQVIRDLRDVLAGKSAHTIAIVEKDKKGYFIETSIIDMNVNHETNQRKFKHCCNSLTLKETERILNEAFN